MAWVLTPETRRIEKDLRGALELGLNLLLHRGPAPYKAHAVSLKDMAWKLEIHADPASLVQDTTFVWERPESGGVLTIHADDSDLLARPLGAKITIWRDAKYGALHASCDRPQLRIVHEQGGLSLVCSTPDEEPINTLASGPGPGDNSFPTSEYYITYEGTRGPRSWESWERRVIFWGISILKEGFRPPSYNRVWVEMPIKIVGGEPSHPAQTGFPASRQWSQYARRRS